MGGDVAAPGAGAAALEQIIGEEFHVSANALRIDARHRRLHVRRKTSRAAAAGHRRERTAGRSAAEAVATHTLNERNQKAPETFLISSPLQLTG